MLKSILVMLTVFVLGGCLLSWGVAFQRLRSGRPLVPGEPRRHVPWGLIDIVMTIMLMVTTLALAAPLVSNLGFAKDLDEEFSQLPENQRPSIFLAGAVGTTLATIASLAMVLLLRRTTDWRDVGVVVSKAWADIKLGVVTFVMLAPIVYGLQFLLVKFVAESHHPLIDVLRETPDVRLLVVSGISAVLVAPICEEYLFRVLLQGWLERVARSDQDTVALVFGGSAEPADHAVSGEFLAASRPDDGNPYHAPDELTAGKAEVEPLKPRQVLTSSLPYWPIILSSAVFALLHLSHGPDFVPLFVLALGLGFLYQRTHRILPCIVVHFLLNAITMLGLIVEVF